MHNKIRTYVTNLLSAAPNCTEKTEILEELIANLCEKYDDMTGSGVNADAAYKEVIAGIGDVSEIVSFIRSSYTYNRSESRNTASSPFEGFEQRMRDFGEQLARDLEGPARTIANDIKNAVRKIETSRGFKRNRYDYTVESTGIASLKFEMKAGDVVLGASPDDKIHVIERSQGNLDESQRVTIEQLGETLRIAQGRSYVGFIYFGFGMVSSDLEVLLPEREWKSLMINDTSGTIDLGAGKRFGNISIKTASGDIRGSALDAQTMLIDVISGDIEFSGHIGALDIRCKSGDITLTEISLGALTVDRISGDLRADGAIGTIELKSKSGDTSFSLSALPVGVNIDSLSGDVKLRLPENEGFTVNYKRLSGDLRSDFNLLTSLNSREGAAVYKNGGAKPYYIKSTSGDIRILRR